MVWLTVKPSLRAASCCSVDVVKGGAGVRRSGRLVTLLTRNCASRHISNTASASSWLLKRVGISAFTSAVLPLSSVVSSTAVMR